MKTAGKAGIGGSCSCLAERLFGYSHNEAMLARSLDLIIPSACVSGIGMDTGGD
jgi:hypothetical protein